MKIGICGIFAALLLIVLAACEEPGDTVLSIDEHGAIIGFAYLDRNGDGVSTPGVDVAFPGVRVALISGARAAATAITDSLGFFRVADLPVGTYTVDVDESSIGDTISVQSIDSARVTVAPNDSAATRITLGYSTTTAELLSSLTPGQRVAFTGTALNAWIAFGDSTLHLQDSTGTVRIVGLPPAAVDAGATIRVVATVGERDGYLALVDPTLVSIGAPRTLAPALLTTAAAADPADSLKLALVRIQAAAMLSATTLPGGDIQLNVNDSSGPLEVVLDVNAAINPAPPIQTGAELDITGVLVPAGGSPLQWRLKPRRSADVIVTYPAIPISAARALQPGQYASIHGIVLNDIATFGTNVLHVTDTSGAIRVNARPGFITAGDSVSVLGRIGVSDGQPVLLDGAVTVIARTTIPAPVDVTPAQAASANGGTLDAALVRVRNVTVRDSSTVNGSRRLVVHGTADSVEVILDRNVPGGFTVPAIGANVDITGLLVPATGGGRWIIRPRGSADITLR